MFTNGAICLLAATIPGIVIRHDRPDSRYLDLAKKYPAVCLIMPDGAGTLVAPTWVLTAGHVASDVRHRRWQEVRFGDAKYPIKSVRVHPDWREMGPADVGLIELARPVKGSAPVGLYEGRDEMGKTVAFVGQGDTGDGKTGPTKRDGKRRAATNVVDGVEPNWLHFTFDPPGKATDLEGISGPGDSGGPALIVMGSKLFVAGVSVFGQNGPGGKGTYGSKETYTRVSTYGDWIRKTAGLAKSQGIKKAAAPSRARKSTR